MGDLHCNLCGTHLGLAEGIKEHYVPKADLRKLAKHGRSLLSKAKSEETRSYLEDFLDDLDEMIERVER